ncbi:MAG: hypothetical protein R3B72_16910 [Polyangiaceae bacterium]
MSSGWWWWASAALVVVGCGGRSGDGDERPRPASTAVPQAAASARGVDYEPPGAVLPPSTGGIPTPSPEIPDVEDPFAVPPPIEEGTGGSGTAL